MPDFSFPAWMRETHSFADSLMKGAQVGAIVANNRYRNQALAAQAIDAERNYELRERQLAAHEKTADLNYKMQSRLIEDQAADKDAITAWIQSRNEKPLEERLTMEMPSLRLPQSYQITNQIADNERMAYSASAKGKAAAALEFRVRQMPAGYQYRFDSTEDPQEKLTILEQGESEIQRRALELRTGQAGALERDLNFMIGQGYITPEGAAALAREKFLGPTETMEMSTDEQGRPVVKVIKGRGGTSAGGPTMAVKTDVQKRLIGFEKSIGMSEKLLSVLKPENVGVAGWLHEVAVDQGLAQAFPELASKQNVSARTLLRIFNETMLRTLKADSQLNKAEEQRILSALPKTGANESLPSATAKIERTMEELRGFARTDAQALGIPLPKPLMSPEDIRAEVGKSLTPEQALQLLKRYHPHFRPDAR
jgi:hypothetical protein